MARKLKSDKVMFIATLLLVALSVVMVYSASAPMALDRYGRATRFLVTQAMWAVLGIAMLTLVMRIDYRHYREPMFIWCGLGFVAFALVCVYFRAPVNGARRWFGVGGIGVQPSELAKLIAIFFIAALLERRMHRIDEVTYSVLPFTIGSGTASLFFWDGTGPVSFAPAALDVSLTINPSTPMGTTASTGAFHVHPLYSLERTIGVPNDGIYLFSGSIGVTTSEAAATARWSPGSLVRARGREWVVLAGSDAEPGHRL